MNKKKKKKKKKIEIIENSGLYIPLIHNDVKKKATEKPDWL